MRRRTGLVAALAAASLASLCAPLPASADWQNVGFGSVWSSHESLTGYHIQADTPQYDMKRIGDTLYVAYVEGFDHHVLLVSRLSADGTRWERVGFRGGLVNLDQGKDAQHPSLAAGPDGTPWIAWDELDAAGIREIRAAHLDASGQQWVEPDGRDWEINYRRPGTDPRDDELWSALTPRLVFLGQRPYIAFVQNNPVEYEIDVVRLAADRRSWEHVARLPEAIPYGVDAAVIGGLLHVGTTAGFDSAAVWRLEHDGNWQALGGGMVNTSVPSGYGYPSGGQFNRVGGLGDDAHVAWRGDGTQVYVAHVVNGAWQLAGGGGLGPAGAGTSLRQIGGRLYVSWIDSSDPTGLHVSRLSDDGSSWIDTGGPVATGVDASPVLSSLHGVPYVLYLRTDGSLNQLQVARLDGAPASIGSDDGEGSGPGSDPNVNAVPNLPPRQQPPPPPPPRRGPCGLELDGTSGTDSLAGTTAADTMRGLSGNDRMSGGDGGDCLFGNGGNDVLFGGNGEDRLSGGAGSDALYGGPDEDRLAGGPGADLLHGGAGWDEFRAGLGNDRIDSADGRGESVHCGRGFDRVRADRFDRLHGCERVTRTG